MVKENKATTFKRLSDFQDYAEATKRAAELKGQQSKLQARVDELESLVGDTAGDDAAIQAEAAAMISGGIAVAEIGARTELVEAKQRLEVVEEAHKMQLQVVAEITKTCQKAMIQERTPGHKKTVERIDSTMAEFELAIADERKFRQEAIDGGLAHNMNQGPALPMIALPGKFGYQDGQSWGMFRAWRQAMSRVGYIKFTGER